MTTSFILNHGEKFIQCPYNTAHQITNNRMIRHLKKCRDAYLKDMSSDEKAQVMRICRFNTLHHVPMPELKYHENTCPNAASTLTFLSWHNSAEGEKHYEERRQRDIELRKRQHSPSPSRDRRDSKSGNDRRRNGDRVCYGSSSANDAANRSNAGTPLEDEEDWEAECIGNVPGYDPQIKLQREIIIHTPQGLTKSERKKHRADVWVKAEAMRNAEDRSGSRLDPGRMDDDRSETARMPAASSTVVKNEPMEMNTDAQDGHENIPSYEAATAARPRSPQFPSNSQSSSSSSTSAGRSSSPADTRQSGPEYSRTQRNSREDKNSSDSERSKDRDKDSRRYNDRDRDRYNDRGRDRYNDRGRDRSNNRDTDRYSDRGSDRYKGRGTERDSDKDSRRNNGRDRPYSQDRNRGHQSSSYNRNYSQQSTSRNSSGVGDWYDYRKKPNNSSDESDSDDFVGFDPYV